MTVTITTMMEKQELLLHHPEGALATPGQWLLSLKVYKRTLLVLNFPTITLTMLIVQGEILALLLFMHQEIQWVGHSDKC